VQSQLVTARPAPGLAGLVSSYTGYRYSGARVGVHVGLPSAALTAIVSLEGPVRTIRPPAPSQHAVELEALVGGLHTRAAHLYEPGSGRGIGIDLTPAGCRSLLGMPVSAVDGWVLPLDELLGPPGRELLDRLQCAGTWPARFAVLDDVLLRCQGRLRPADAAVEHAWRRLTGGPVRVDAVAADVGYSRRHLGERFSREYGLRPKTVARLARFDRSRSLLQVAAPPTLSVVAAACGYADQAHLAREWREFAGASPTGWRTSEDLLFVQDEQAGERAR
jgi:AraC-like DNA-binding protein